MPCPEYVAIRKQVLDEICDTVREVLDETDKYMPAEMAAKVREATIGVRITIDNVLSATSENPVQNKVIYEALEGIEAQLSTISANAVVNTTAYWNAQLDFIPARGEIIVYTDHGAVEVDGRTVNVPAIKIGDGLAYCVDLPFVGDADRAYILAQLTAHANNTDIHTTAQEKSIWNGKISCLLSGETLLLTTD